jgi:3-oxoacyl-[acyl-carrier-protein] synthase I
VKPLAVTSFGIASSLGRGSAATMTAMREGRSGLRPNDLESVELETWIGRVPELESMSITGPSLYDCRNNRLALLGLQQDGFEDAVATARERYGAERIAVLIGTSTSGIQQTERAFRQRHPATGALPAWFHYRETHNVFSVCDFVQQWLGLRGPAAAISTACSSSAKAFASAHRLIEGGFVDAAVVGGVDSICLTTLYGFNSLELLSREPCRPCDASRNGISIGEAAGFALLERPQREADRLALHGYGESSDSYHMSSPHPDGEGAVVAMRAALTRAQLEPRDIDYVNMHGTGTPSNDRAEDAALHRVFGDTVPCSSTKGLTGHTLGAAGIVEAILSLLCLQHGFIPGTLNVRELDPSLRSRIALASEERTLRYVLSNSFGFGGSNCSLVFGQLV